MKTCKIKFNVLTVMLQCFMLTALIFLFNACNNSVKDDTNGELTEEVQDVKEELDEILVNEKKALKSDIDSVVTAFDNQMSEIESKIIEGNIKLNNKANLMLENIKAERDTLNMKLDEIEKQTEETWIEFKNEVEHDSKQFTNHIEDFFKNNT